MSHIHFAPQCGSLCSWSSSLSGSVNNRVNFRETERRENSLSLWVPSSATFSPPHFCSSITHKSLSPPPLPPPVTSCTTVLMQMWLASFLSSKCSENMLPVIVKPFIVWSYCTVYLALGTNKLWESLTFLGWYTNPALCRVEQEDWDLSRVVMLRSDLKQTVSLAGILEMWATCWFCRLCIDAKLNYPASCCGANLLIQLWPITCISPKMPLFFCKVLCVLLDQGQLTTLSTPL